MYVLGLLQWFEQCLSEEEVKEEGSPPLPTSPLMLLLLLTSLMIKFNFQGISLLHDLLPQLIELGKISGNACRKTMSQDDLHNLQLPSPWTLGKTVESVHPVFEQYKLEETITFPGAKELFLKFDEKCSTQYNYDKVCGVCSTVCIRGYSLVVVMYVFSPWLCLFSWLCTLARPRMLRLPTPSGGTDMDLGVPAGTGQKIV